jgi:hypothetical protein
VTRDIAGIVLAAATLLGAAAVLRRAYADLRARLTVIECAVDEAVGRLTVLTAEHAGGYESESFARVSPAGRERIEAATIGLEAAKWN